MMCPSDRKLPSSLFSQTGLVIGANRRPTACVRSGDFLDTAAGVEAWRNISASNERRCT